MLDNEQKVDFTEHWTNVQATVAAYVRGIVRDPHVARDIVQNTAIVLLRKFDLWNADQEFLPWALGFAKFEILAHFRDSARNRVVFTDVMVDSLTEMWPGVSNEIQTEELALRDCVEKLAPKAREMVHLRYFQEMEVQHVADSLQSTPGAVRVALMRIRRQLMDCVNRHLQTLGRET